jgi:hypothetical protein
MNKNGMIAWAGCKRRKDLQDTGRLTTPQQDERGHIASAEK